MSFPKLYRFFSRLWRTRFKREDSSSASSFVIPSTRSFSIPEKKFIIFKCCCSPFFVRRICFNRASSFSSFLVISSFFSMDCNILLAVALEIKNSCSMSFWQMTLSLLQYKKPSVRPLHRCHTISVIRTIPVAVHPYHIVYDPDIVSKFSLFAHFIILLFFPEKFIDI